MEAPRYGVDPDMAAMTIAGTTMESAVARFKRLKSAQEGSSVTPPSDNDAGMSSKVKPLLGLSNGRLPTGVSNRQLLPALKEPIPPLDRRSFETIDSALGESLSEADVPKQRSSVRDQTIAAHQDQYHGAGEVQLQKPPTMPSSTVIRSGRPSGSTTKEHTMVPNPQTGDNRNQLQADQAALSSNINTNVRTNASKDNGIRLAKVSEAIKARHRKHGSGDLPHTTSNGMASTEIRHDKEISGQGQSISKNSLSDGPRRQLFKGQHAIRSGSGAKIPASASRRSSTTEAIPHHAILYNSAYPHSTPKPRIRLLDTSRGPELDDPPSICKGDIELINIFTTCVQPAIETSMDRYRNSVLPSSLLLAMGKRVAKDTITEKFVDFLKRGDYRLDRPQKKLIRNYVKQNFAAGVKLAIEKIQAGTLKEAQAQHNSPAICSADSSLYGHESVHGRELPEDVLDTYSIDQRTDKAEHAEADTMAGLSNSNSTSRLEPTSTKLNSNVVPRRCILCRDGHLKCVPQGANCLACNKRGLSCTFRPQDVIFNVPFMGKENPSTTTQRRSVGPVTDRDNAALRAESLLVDNGPPDSRQACGQAEYSSRPTREQLQRHVYDVNEDLPKADPSSSQRSPHLPKPKSRTAFSPELELAMANATLSEPGGSAGFPRPYKSLTQGHFDFIRAECLLILHTLDSLDQLPCRIYPAETTDLYQQIKTRLGQPSEDRLTAIVQAVSIRSDPALVGRKKKNVRAFLVDIRDDTIPSCAQPKFAKPNFKVAEASRPKATISSLLRNRELGAADDPSTIASKGFARDSGLQGTLGVRIAEHIRPWKSWKGASSDVVTVAWAPNSLSYAAGAAAQSDENDLQYNRPNNLLFGQLEPNVVSELPDHCIDRPRPETISSGPNANLDVYRACDPMVYKTVTTVQFSPCGGLLYTASHDKTVKIWDVNRPGLPSCVETLDHDAHVTSLEVSTHFPQLFATAAQSIGESIRVYRPVQEALHGDSQPGFDFTSFTSTRAIKHRDWSIYPECVRFGVAPGSKHLLLGGFQEWVDQDFNPARQGHLCLWDIHTTAKISVQPHVSAIFAAAWHPQENLFICGGAPGSGVGLSYPRTTQSVVRLYDPRIKNSYTAEFECPGTDMQDVTFHPFSSYVTAGCTNGTTYVWDCRMPDYVMHRLEHGDPLQELAVNEDHLPYMKHRERYDTGIMLSIWGRGASLFYTGSSDGVIKAWDILRAPEDVCVRDVVQLPAGVQSGALSPDGMNMLVGDAVGGVHILSAAPTGLSVEDDSAGYHPDPITFVAANKKKNIAIEEVGTEGINEANELLRSGRLSFYPSFGVGKGPNYHNYFAKYARWANSGTGYNELRPEFDRQQAFNAAGVEQTAQSLRIRNIISARRSQLIAATEDIKPRLVSLGPPISFVANRRSGSIPSPKPRPPRTMTISPDPLEAVCPSAKASSVRSSKAQSATPKAASFSKPTAINTIDLDPYVSPAPTPSKKRKHTGSPSGSPCKHSKFEAIGYKNSPGPKRFPSTNTHDIIDLTGDDLDYSVAKPSVKATAAAVPDRKPRPYSGGAIRAKEEITEERVVEEEEEENLLSYEEWVEEDHWWPEGC
ncbi:MAG: hypothetical protein Q9224_002879 [Gallowayella concinna]